jgi:hypothetical protein
MGRVRTAVRGGARWSQPLARNIARSQAASRRVDEIVVLPMPDPDTAVALATEFSARVGEPHKGDLAIGIAVPGADNRALAATLGDHRRAGGDALVLLVGNAAERRALERELRTDLDVGIAVMLFVDRLDGDDLARIRRRVADAIIARREGARRHYAGLDDEVARQLERRMAMKLAVRSVLVQDSGRVAAGLKAGHTKIVADRGSRGESPIDPKAIGLMVGLAMLTPLWHHGARRLDAFVPFTRVALRGGAAYATTRLVGLVAARLAASGRTSQQEEH